MDCAKACNLETGNAPLIALVAEDSPVFQSMLRILLERWGYGVTMAADGREAWERLEATDGPRLAILDWMMPGLDGVEVCRRVRAGAREDYVYILLLTARTESRYLIEGMEAGADDYLTKPFNAHELRVRLRAGRRILELQAELLQARDALQRQATHDGLTGVWNRTAILEILERELERARREDAPVAVLMLDLDHFKRVNDTRGHLAGDEVLRQMVRRMEAELRSYDSVGRYGGEEFMVVLPGCSGLVAAARAESLRQALTQREFSVNGEAIEVTCSLGVSWSTASDGTGQEMLVRAADEALYRAKRRGRNCVEITCPEPSPAWA
ncbi:MAG: diguanylate cyclase [Bryobacteraceae bacterium]